LEIYQKYDSWDLSLRDLALVNGSLPDILLLSAPIFENDLSLVDPFLKPLVQANYAGNSYLTKFEVSINEILDMYENSRQELEAHRNDRRPYYAMPLAGFHGGALVLRLFNENSPIGILTIVGNNPLRAFDVPLLRRLAQYVEHALPGFLSVNNHFLSNTMQILLLEGRIDPDVMRSLLAMHGVNRSDTYRCLAISGSDGSRYDEIAHRPLESAFATLPGSVVLAFQEYLVAFVNWPAAEKEKRVEKVKAILERFQLNAGISDPFSEFMDARLYYLQAVEAQKLARAAGDTSRLADFRGYCCQYIVKSCSGAIRPELIYSEGFRNLIDQNRRAAFDYIETLEIYLDENMNAAKAAKRLFIQRNSFLYRLEQITAILGEDLRDPDARFLLNACLRLLRQSGG
jgi:hypothetical protein